MQKFGIDTSRWQGDFDYGKAKTEHQIEFAILKIGGGDDGLYKDREFDNSYAKCEKAGIDKGCYFFGHAMNMEDAKKEADYILKLLEGKKFEYPVFYDVEADMLSVEKGLLTNICAYVLETVEKAGYWVGIYANSYALNNKINDKALSRYSHWVAEWDNSKPVLNSGNEVQMWQFGGERNQIRNTHINNRIVDQNYCYKDYPTLIKKYGLNNYKKATSVTPNVVPNTTKTEQKTETTVTNVQNTFVLTKECYTFWSVAQKLNCSVSDIQRLNPTLDPKKLHIGQVINVPGTSKVTYVSKPATKTFTLTKDCYTFWSVSKKLGCTVTEIQNLNPTLDPKKLHIGQVIVVPNK